MSKGFHTRGYLPHWDLKNATQAITFRLDDSLPKHVIMEWREDLLEIKDDELREKELHRLISKFEDKGHGSCVLKDPVCAGIVREKLRAGDRDAYKLLDWCVMPNHVHTMIRILDETPLSKIVQKWKGGSSVGINRYLGEGGALWHREYYDRLVRDEENYYKCSRYIRMNPVKALLCEKPEDWKFSSAWNEER